MPGLRSRSLAQRLQQLPVHPPGVAVDDDEVRAEGRERGVHHPGAQGGQVAHAHGEVAGRVAARALADPGQHHPVEAVGAP